MPEQGPVLAFDTSAAHCAAALVQGDRVLAHRHEEMALGQAERLLPLLAELLDEAGLDWSDLALITTGVGPGNFTGIRISVATARGLALGLGIRSVGVSTLDALREGHEATVLPSIDARGGKLYLGLPSGPELCALDALPDLPWEALCIGHEAERLAELCGGTVAEPALPLAVAIAQIARDGRGEAVSRPRPLYIRAPDAAPAKPAPPVA
ncbi:tRNA (adenosine(37)-N6)-threonylcarbamoyltransferase complex dimerization subunit type 1 TsaB [Palleronia caenipelagi]|uniref:tRNA (Adenosine(37)-N6)-threonylcarbamoyltransferase complex dimerization subunit type 1 TsaB n=1 Tax=Palleronia caenipelagi TaxID=2489174 RepID=A0A547Q584_9RHOB|nr:tRNA (adenosine(37)-N6)-threonylcarbamoyltransferase complex dimerization subunit type 1 TsaB [Palleronia caenipelagi]TRD21544.1 tRNA (adenosine(37)-N6)-threonylcarbamoyltransferase complex dimerization subunit type 1 TsaB [Palleronia caenipelagi]